MRLFLLFILLIFSTQFLFAQNDKIFDEDSVLAEKSDFKFKRYRWDVSTSIPSLLSNIVPLFYSNNNTTNSAYLNPYVIQIRRNVLEDVPGKFSKRRAAYRLRIGFDVNQRIGDQVDTQSVLQNGQSYDYYVYGDKSDVVLKLNAGKEWQRQMGRFQLIYGLDLTASINSSKGTVTQVTNYNPQALALVTYEERSSTTSFGLAPFFGMKFFIDSRISIAAEASFNFLHVTTDYRELYGTYVLGHKQDYVRASLSPLSFLSLNYHFN